MSKQTRRKVLRRQMEGWPCVQEAAKRSGKTPAEVARQITACLPWDLTTEGSDTLRAAKIVFAVNAEARRIGAPQ